MRRLVPLLVCSLLLFGCATNKRGDTLTSTLNAYANAMRWGDFPSALQFVDPNVLAQHPPSALDMARYSQVRVTGYDDGNGPIPAGENEVRQVVQLSLTNLNTQSERSVVDRQDWRYDAAANRWWLTSGLPDITQP